MILCISSLHEPLDRTCTRCCLSRLVRRLGFLGGRYALLASVHGCSCCRLDQIPFLYPGKVDSTSLRARSTASSALDRLGHWASCEEVDAAVELLHAFKLLHLSIEIAKLHASLCANILLLIELHELELPLLVLRVLHQEGPELSTSIIAHEVGLILEDWIRVMQLAESLVLNWPVRALGDILDAEAAELAPRGPAQLTSIRALQAMGRVDCTLPS